MSASAVAGVVLGALYMLRFAQRFLFGAARAPHAPVVDLDGREKVILIAIAVAIFALGLYPDEPMRKSELAAIQYRQQVAGERSPANPPKLAGSESPAGRPAMNWQGALLAMLPEHLLLAGIVLLICLEIVPGRPRGALALALLAVTAAAAAALTMHANGYAASPFPGQYLGEPGRVARQGAGALACGARAAALPR